MGEAQDQAQAGTSGAPDQSAHTPEAVEAAVTETAPETPETAPEAAPETPETAPEAAPETPETEATE